ncbi:L-rhamnose mutarotase [Pseudarthrobacter sp. 1C304]|uniref:L-rhamnose mutarotase n=1 Tax=Pseudarthrobacter sp. 1C304 TaxID=3457438 RepID=UPI003FD5952E
MEVIALHTRLKEGRIDEYEAVHAVIPTELDSALRRAGVKSWRIWRDGLDLFHWVEVDDFAMMKAALAAEPADVAWQEQIAELLQAQESYTDSDSGLPLVWELPIRPAEL